MAIDFECGYRCRADEGPDRCSAPGMHGPICTLEAGDTCPEMERQDTELERLAESQVQDLKDRLER